MKLPFAAHGLHTALVLVSLLTGPVALAAVEGHGHGHGQEIWEVGQRVQTTSGWVDGQSAGSDAPEVSEYLGIPYAKPPVRELRFEPPEAYTSDHIIDATRFGKACWQLPWASMDEESMEKRGVPESAEPIFKAFRMGDEHVVGPMSEDCLTLNVWTKRQEGESAKAVIVWIHGGSFRTGSSKFPIYNGKHIANQDDVVVLSFNYRLNVFGFPGNPDMPTNHGLRDVRLAMKWVRDNVAGFGGDVSRITMMGQSAGAGMIDHYTYAFAEDPIASAFIMLSGASEGYNGPSTPERGEETWLILAENVGCGSSAKPVRERRAAVLECMMEKPAQDIVDGMAMENVKGRFEPLDDGVIVYADHSNMTSAKGSYLLGVANFEGGIHLPVWPNAPKFVLRALGHIIINCPTAERINKALAEGHPTWRYRYFGEFPNLEATTSPPSGSWHGSDVPVLFDTAPEEAIPNTPEEDRVGSYMRNAFAAFAKDPVAGLLSYGEGWPRYDPERNTLIRLGYRNRAGPNLTKGRRYDTLCVAHSALRALHRMWQ